MARLRVQAFIRDEAGNKLGGTGYEVRFYQAGTNTLQTLYPDAASGTTIPNPHYPNSGAQVALGAQPLTTDTVITLNSLASFQLGDFITFDDGTVRTERCITAINVGASQITINAAIGRAYTIASTRVNGRENLGHVAAYADTTADIEVTAKNLATGIEGPRELFRITPVSGNDFVKIAESVLGVAAASVVFSSIPSTYRHLLLEWYARGDTAAASTNILLRINNDAAANYDWQRMLAAAATQTDSESLGATSIYCGDIPANTATAAYFGGGAIDVPGYASTTGGKIVIVRNFAMTANTTGTGTVYVTGGKWRTTATAINRLDLLPGAGNFAAGSIFSLYGRT
jgi:hypothetical protein